MEGKLEEKKEWITPEIIDLDVEKTGKDVTAFVERTLGASTFEGPSLS